MVKLRAANRTLCSVDDGFSGLLGIFDTPCQL